MLVQGKITGDTFVDFLKRLIHKWSRPIFLIVDGHPIHKSAAVSKFITSTKGRLQLFFLPPYSPELNPDEQVWNHLKNHGIGRQPITGPDQLKLLILSHLKKDTETTIPGTIFLPNARNILYLVSVSPLYYETISKVERIIFRW